MGVFEEQLPAFKLAAAKLTEELTKNPKSARDFLILAGILNQDGSLHENYEVSNGV